ncbi:hypothetical protein LTR10_014957 [Elasticomyces elasticus]|nr:hypothetical protein LTR10_014957 [Elasticomyces elasticus]KAK4964534.1 hypothetical protein LTR42_012830 [Elasticomyces elasticus]
MNAPQQRMQAFPYQLNTRQAVQDTQTSMTQGQQAAEPTQTSAPRQAAQPTQTSVSQTQQAAEPIQTSEPSPPSQPPPVQAAGEIPVDLVYLAAGGWLGPSYWGEVDIALVTGTPAATTGGESRSQHTTADTTSARPDSVQLAQMLVPNSAQLQPIQAPPAATPVPMLALPPVNAEPAASHISTAMALDPPNIPQASNAQPASNIPPIAMTSQPSPANAQPAVNPQLMSTAPPSQSLQPVRQFAPPFDPRPFGKLQRTATGHWSRLTPPSASLSAVSNGEPASNPLVDTMASQPPLADAQPDANRLLTAMASPALHIQPASKMPPSISMAPPPQPVYLPTNRQLPVNPYPLRDPQYRLTHMTYYNLPTCRSRQPASNAPRTAGDPHPASATDGQPASNVSRAAVNPQPLSAGDRQPALNVSRNVVVPQPQSANEHSDSKHSSRTAAPSAKTAHSSANPHSTSNVQPAPDDSSAPKTPPSQLAQPVAKPEPVADAQPASAAPSMLEAPDPQPAQPVSNPAFASSTPPDPAQPDEYPHPLRNAAQLYLEHPPTNTTDRFIERELRAVYDKLIYTRMNTLRTKYLATLSTQRKVTLMQCNTDPVVLYLLAELNNENLRLTLDDPNKWNYDPVHDAADRVKARIETAEGFAKQKEKREKKIKVEGAAVSQPNGMSMRSGQQTGMVRKLQLVNAMNAGGTMPAQPVNVPIGSGHYYGAVNGQELGQVSNGVGMMPAQPSNVPLSSRQHFGPASGPQPGNDMKPDGWSLTPPSNVPVGSRQHLGGVNSQQSGTASNNVGGSSADHYENVHERPNYPPGPYEMDERQVKYQKRSKNRSLLHAAYRESEAALARSQQLGNTKEEKCQKRKMVARERRAAVVGGKEAELAREQQLGSSAMGSGQQFGSVPGQQQWNNMNGPPMGYPAGMQLHWGPPIMAPMQQVGAMGWPQQDRAMSEHQQGYAVAGPWPGNVTVEGRSMLPGGVGSRQNPEVIE